MAEIRKHLETSYSILGKNDMDLLKKPSTYALPERIGEPDLLIGRDEEFTEYGKWISRIPKRIGKSRTIIARKKSGKTAFVQRIFNQLWNRKDENKEIPVIPFYYEIRDIKTWLPSFAIHYYRCFASQYISLPHCLFRKSWNMEKSIPMSFWFGM